MLSVSWRVGSGSCSHLNLPMYPSHSRASPPGPSGPSCYEVLGSACFGQDSSWVDNHEIWCSRCDWSLLCEGYWGFLFLLPPPCQTGSLAPWQAEGALLPIQRLSFWLVSITHRTCQSFRFFFFSLFSLTYHILKACFWRVNGLFIAQCSLVNIDGSGIWSPNGDLLPLKVLKRTWQ